MHRSDRYGIMFVLLLMIFLMSNFGCSHSLKIKNVYNYSARMPYIEDNIKIGLVTNSFGKAEHFFNAFLDECYGLGRNVEVIYPYAYGAKKQVDYIVELNPEIDYDGSGMNFIISFPGFLIFTPGWHGYNYSVDIYTDVTVTDYDTRKTVFRKRYYTEYKCSHSEFDRTWTTGVDWLLTGGVCSLLGGCYFVTYDDDITYEFNNRLSRPYGNYIARKVMGQIQIRHDRFRPDKKETLDSDNQTTT